MKPKFYTTLLAVAFLLMPWMVKGQSTTNNRFGKGIEIIDVDSTFSMKFSTRFQTLYEGKMSVDDKDWSDKILLRRMRLKFSGFAHSPKVQYKIELGISNRDISSPIPQTSNAARIILDAVLKWNFAGNWSLWAGQTKLPGNRERIISSQKLQFVDRSNVNSKFTLDRDVGLQLKHKDKIGENFILKETASISMGEGRNITSNNVGGYDYTFRLEILPFGEFESKGDYFGSDLKREKTPKLAIGLAYDFLDGAARQRGQQGSFMEGTNGAVLTDLSTVFADLVLKYNGWSIVGEYANKKNVDKIVAVTGPNETMKFFSGVGYMGSVGYLLKNNFEIAARYTYVVPDDVAISGLTEQSEYTLGASRYFSGHNLKVQSDASLLQTPGKSDEFRFRLQMELSF